jgi:hypothetical protein
LTGLARGRGSCSRESGRGSSAAWSRSAWRGGRRRCPGRILVPGEVRSSSAQHRPFYGRGGLLMRAHNHRGGPPVADDEPGSSTWRSGLRGRPRCAQCLRKARHLGRCADRTARQARRRCDARAARDVAARRGAASTGSNLFHSTSVRTRKSPKF